MHCCRTLFQWNPFDTSKVFDERFAKLQSKLAIGSAYRNVINRKFAKQFWFVVTLKGIGEIYTTNLGLGANLMEIWLETSLIVTWFDYNCYSALTVGKLASFVNNWEKSCRHLPRKFIRNQKWKLLSPCRRPEIISISFEMQREPSNYSGTFSELTLVGNFLHAYVPTFRAVDILSFTYRLGPYPSSLDVSLMTIN